MVDMRRMYRAMENDIFPATMEITFGDMTIHYQKVLWDIDGKEKGLRYGENPGQPSALYRPVDGNLILGGVEFIKPNMGLVCDMELLQSGKHPGKINLTDVDGALNILKYFPNKPTVVIMKHNNPCGVATRPTLAGAYYEANMADRVAAFGGAIALNRPCDKATAELIVKNYSEVVVAPAYQSGALSILRRKKDLRILRITNIERLHEWQRAVFPEIKSLCDGGVIVQTSFLPRIRSVDDLKSTGVVPHDIPERMIKDGKLTETGKSVSMGRRPTGEEYRDMLFGWLVESGITSNSVIYVKNEATVGIGTGEQDRVGVAAIARDKAYTKLKDRICFERYGMAYNILLQENRKATDEPEKGRTRAMLEIINDEVAQQHGSLKGAVMVSDAFFPFRDGVDVGLNEGISAVIQPGGSNRDYESVVACNEHDAVMIFTGQRSFKH
jgi:phosphoribosylaminoimidazolecarboxamide formyltransferase/IMP cyclohydrolase